MRRLLSMITGVALGAALMWGGLKYHVLRTNDGLVYVPKREATLTDTYLDVRSWTVADWTTHPDLVWTLAQNGKGDVVKDPNVLQATLNSAIRQIK